MTAEVKPNLSGFARPKAITALHQPFLENGQLVLGSNPALAHVRSLSNGQSRVYGVYGVHGSEQVIATPATDTPGVTSSYPALAALPDDPGPDARGGTRAGAVFGGGEGETAFLAWAGQGGASDDTSGLAVQGCTFTVTSQGQLL
ncbi:hypothetical protein [Streptomyces solicathayae]|uniref:Head decoration protein n=1 Tax=Streptomyces solicathayae TaxID=3081768 RepID=A0ABZ0M4S3_9ACTN|nr:hypothetical protein [Streptomyces sp. HUAS YS2]WOX26480.1 hypothetical protein R2D22_35940 [Streptomyces sp. HUAS YS2]